MIDRTFDRNTTWLPPRWIALVIVLLGALELLLVLYTLVQKVTASETLPDHGNDIHIESGKEGIQLKNKPKLLQVKKPFQKFLQIGTETAQSDQDPEDPESQTSV